MGKKSGCQARPVSFLHVLQNTYASLRNTRAFVWFHAYPGLVCSAAAVHRKERREETLLLLSISARWVHVNVGIVLSVVENLTAANTVADAREPEPLRASQMAPQKVPQATQHYGLPASVRWMFLELLSKTLAPPDLPYTAMHARCRTSASHRRRLVRVLVTPCTCFPATTARRHWHRPLGSLGMVLGVDSAAQA